MSHFSCFYYFMLGLLDLANSYCETQLKRQCERIIKQGITVDNSAMLLAAAIKYEAAVSIVGSGAYNNGKYLYLSNWFKFLIFTLKKNDMCSVVQKIWIPMIKIMTEAHATTSSCRWKALELQQVRQTQRQSRQTVILQTDRQTADWLCQYIVGSRRLDTVAFHC